jgi:hypothetical protein
MFKRVCAVVLGVIPGFAQVGLGIGVTVAGVVTANPLLIGLGIGFGGLGVPYLAVSLHLANSTRDRLQEARVHRKRAAERKHLPPAEPGTEPASQDLDNAAQQVSTEFERMVLSSNNPDARRLVKEHSGELSPQRLADLPSFAERMIKEYEAGNFHPEPLQPSRNLADTNLV